jgi:hypothetical protein
LFFVRVGLGGYDWVSVGNGFEKIAVRIYKRAHYPQTIFLIALDFMLFVHGLNEILVVK